MSRCTAQHWFSTDRPASYSQCVRDVDDLHGDSALEPHEDALGRCWHVYSEPKRSSNMDGLEQRQAHAARIAALLPELVASGGDVLAVIRGQMERFVEGARRYGPLDLDDPHDWQLEEDEELADVENYRSIKRTLQRRGQSRSALRHATPEAESAIDRAGLRGHDDCAAADLAIAADVDELRRRMERVEERERADDTKTEEHW